MHRMIIVLIFLIVGLSAMAQQEHTFSFASDSQTDAPTFISNAPDRIESDTVVELLSDFNEHQTGGRISFQAIHKMEAYVHSYNLFPCGSNFLHTWKVEGQIYFAHYSAPGDPPIMEVRFYQAVLTALSPKKDFIVDSMTLHVNEQSDPNMTITPLQILNGLGLGPFDLDRSENFAYTFTDIKNLAGGSTVKIDGAGNFLEKWTSEGSFSASAF